MTMDAALAGPGIAEPTAEAVQRVLRFNRTQRLVHWVQAITFLILLATGLAIGISGLQGIIGNRALLRETHLIAAFLFVFGPSLVALAGNRRSIKDDASEVDAWTPEDVQWLAHPTTRPETWTPMVRRYNAGQKLNAIFTVYATLAFGVTGLILWQNRRFPFGIVSQANVIHTDLAYIALAVFLGHLYLSAIHPTTRESLNGMIRGTVDRAWARTHHPGWAPALQEAPLRFESVLRSLAMLALGLEASLLAVRLGFEWLGANATDPVTKLIYRFSGLPGTLHHQAAGLHQFDLAALIWLGLLAVALVAMTRAEDLLPRLMPAARN